MFDLHKYQSFIKLYGNDPEENPQEEPIPFAIQGDQQSFDLEIYHLHELQNVYKNIPINTQTFQIEINTREDEFPDYVNYQIGQFHRYRNNNEIDTEKFTIRINFQAIVESKDYDQRTIQLCKSNHEGINWDFKVQVQNFMTKDLVKNIKVLYLPKTQDIEKNFYQILQDNQLKKIENKIFTTKNCLFVQQQRLFQSRDIENYVIEYFQKFYNRITIIIPIYNNEPKLDKVQIFESLDYLSEQIFFLKNNRFHVLFGEKFAYKENYQIAFFVQNDKMSHTKQRSKNLFIIQRDQNNNQKLHFKQTLLKDIQDQTLSYIFEEEVFIIQSYYSIYLQFFRTQEDEENSFQIKKLNWIHFENYSLLVNTSWYQNYLEIPAILYKDQNHFEFKYLSDNFDLIENPLYFQNLNSQKNIFNLVARTSNSSPKTMFFLIEENENNNDDIKKFENIDYSMIIPFCFKIAYDKNKNSYQIVDMNSFYQNISYSQNEIDFLKDEKWYIKELLNKVEPIKLTTLNKLMLEINIKEKNQQNLQIYFDQRHFQKHNKDENLLINDKVCGMINSDYDNSIWYKYEVSSKKNSSKINIKLYRFLGFSKMMYDKIL